MSGIQTRLVAKSNL